MSEAPKWTPGPWLVRPSKYDDWGTVRAGIDGPIVAQARAGDAVDLNEHRRLGTDPYGINANLIAAAPDLYEALSRVMQWVDGWDPNFIFDDDRSEDADLIKSALAKARGEQS